MRTQGWPQQQKMLQPDPRKYDRTEGHHEFEFGFYISIEQDKKGNDKAHDEDGPGQPIPWSEHGAFYDVARLFRDVGVPDNDELAVKEICPRQAKRKEEFAQIVKMG